MNVKELKKKSEPKGNDVVTSVRIKATTRNFLKKHKIKLNVLIETSVDELRDQIKK